MAERYEERMKRNERSRYRAEHHREPWSAEELEWIRMWEPGDEELLREIAELLGRTIEACRQQYYLSRSQGWSMSHTKTIRYSDGSSTTETTTYRGWRESDGDGW